MRFSGMTWKIKMLLKIVIIKFSQRFPNAMSDETYSKLLYFVVFGKRIDLDNPKTFNENIIVRKLEDKKYEYDKYTDKYEVRKYVEEQVGQAVLNEVYGVFDTFDDIDFSKLPDSFALKATHASGFNIIVKDKNKFDIVDAKKKFGKWLKVNFYYKDREKNYKNIKPRILCDKYIEFDDVLVEYKIYCFNGKAKLVCQNVDKDSVRYTNVLDANFSRIPVKFGYDTIDYPITKNKVELIEIAERLSGPFDFVRVDLYENGGRILFSELTFHSGGGLVPFSPKKYDVEFGKLFLNEEII